MSPWTALLESLHSALIDELTEQHPEPKPGLGLPSRQREFFLPSANLKEAVGIEVTFDDKLSGWICVALDPSARRSLEMTPHDLWNAVFKRAGAEFSRRNIRPRICQVFQIDLALPESADPQRVVWIPMSVGEGKCFLAMAV